VVLALYPGRKLNERELQGVKHLTSSAVPGLGVDNVTVVDQTGAILGGDKKIRHGCR
jgi:flagellar M-ring protein FliF